ncbi:Nucleolar protein 12 [Erysiphe necator]|nr:Nucleolar protein 12 [Erysiphe necator]
MGPIKEKKSLNIDRAAIDPTLALLFSSNLESETSLKKSCSSPRKLADNLNHIEKQKNVPHYNEEVNGELYNHIKTNPFEDHTKAYALKKNLSGAKEPLFKENSEKIVFHNKRKRKRKLNDENLEAEYMQKLAKQEDKEQKQLEARRNLKNQKLVSEDVDLSDPLGIKDGQSSTSHISPDHESTNFSKKDNELEKASRTVFLANVSTLAISSKKAKKILLNHLGSFLSDLPLPPEGTPPHKVESLRFRSTAYSGTSLPKRAAYAKKEIMEATTKGTNAYVVYSNAYAARAAVKKLNASVVLNRHLRVDSVAHPSKIDHRRCVFVGNLGFVDDESSLDKTDGTLRKRSKIPADIEEGLWIQFSKVGAVENVRVVRDEKTRIGKGFAYVQFTDPNKVEAALLLNEKKFPPMLPRVLRVVRAKSSSKTASVLANRSVKKKLPNTINSAIFNPKLSSEQLSLGGRASKLLGKSGAAKLRTESDTTILGNTIKYPKSGPRKNLSLVGDKTKNLSHGLVFEGHRARSTSVKLKKAKLGLKSKSKRPNTRSSRRASEWKSKNKKKNG